MSVGENDNRAAASEALRAELKKWENTFRDANGRRAARADIKADATIAAKYKLFDRLKARKAEQPPPAEAPKTSTRPSEPTHKETSKVSPTPRTTPSKATQSTLQPHVLSPVQEEPTPAFIRNALGPTPQRDGQVLGIFDIDSGPTPSKVENAAASGLDMFVAGTPSKGAPQSSDEAFSKTPQSISKRYYLDAFAGTPLKRKRDQDDVGTTSSSKRKFATPAFLRRSFPMASIDEESESTAVSKPPFRKRGLVRSLSSIIQGLKKQEVERMDEEWDIMDEIEQEQQEPKKSDVPKVLVGDSQATEMPLGPDQAPESDEESGPENRETGRKPWKKKGLKRQTRRVIMRPVLHKAQKADDAKGSGEEAEDVVAESQPQDLAAGGEDDAEDSTFEDELAGEPAAPKAKGKGKKEIKKHEEKEDAGKKKPRKVNPDAHANYRRLNIKNKNSKANGRGKRFGRR